MNSNHFLLIEDFSETISTIFKNFSQICKAHAEKLKQARPEYVRIQNEIIQERNKRMQLEKLVRQRLTETAEKPTDAPSENINWKRPKSGFQLYFMEEQERMIKEHPGLNVQKVGTLAAIKWKHLKKQQRAVYDKRVQEMNKISDEELIQANQKMKANNDACYIKRQYTQEEEPQNEQDANLQDQSQNQGQSENQNQKDFQSYNREQPNRKEDEQQEEPNKGQEEVSQNINIQNTQMIENEQANQPTLQMEESQQNRDQNQPNDSSLQQQSQNE